MGDQTTLEPVLGRPQLLVYSVGVIVGAGVYAVIGTAAELAQDKLWLSFLIGAAVALLTAISYAELATAFPRAGAEYYYLRMAWPAAEWLSFCVGVIILLGGAATAATVATAFGGYLSYFVEVPPVVSAFALLALCTALNILGLRAASWMNMVFTAMEVAGLLLVAAAAAASWGGPMPEPPPGVGEPAIMTAAALLFFVYLGFEEVANLAEEVRRPGRDVPFALFASLGLTTALYVMVAIAVVHLAPTSALGASEAPLAMAVERVWPSLGGLLGAIALFATANTVLIMLIATSRLAFAMGRLGELPRPFAKLSKTGRTPWVAAIFAGATAMVLLPAGGLKLLAEMSSFAALLAFLAVNSALIRLRYRMPDHPRPFRAPWSIGRLPLLPVAAILSIGGLLGHFDRSVYIAGAIALALSALAYFALRPGRGAKP